MSSCENLVKRALPATFDALSPEDFAQLPMVAAE
jgi:hypothetical protein